MARAEGPPTLVLVPPAAHAGHMLISETLRRSTAAVGPDATIATAASVMDSAGVAPSSWSTTVSPQASSPTVTSCAAAWPEDCRPMRASYEVQP